MFILSTNQADTKNIAKCMIFISRKRVFHVFLKAQRSPWPQVCASPTTTDVLSWH